MSLYNNAIPQAGNRLASSQQDLLNNFQQLDTTFGVDHYDFSDGTANNGKHNQVTMPGQSSPPPASVAGDGVIYTNTASSLTDVYYTQDNSTDEYRLTRVGSNATDVARFATNTNYQVGPPSLTGGWTFLPGGMLLQYGIAASQNTSLPNITVTFPKAYTNVVYSVTCTIVETADTRRFISVYDVANNQFRATLRNSGGSKTAGINFYWQAIGV
jgi:hypothetical protein